MGVHQRHRDEAALEDMQVGDHLCWVYADEREFRDGLTRYVADGIEQQQLLACYLPGRALDDLRRHLTARIPGFRQAEARGTLLLQATAEAYLPGGTFDASARLTGFAEMSDRAVAMGAPALRVLGEATELAGDVSIREEWPGYELRADLLIARLPILAVCAYDARRCGSAPMGVVRAVHPLDIGGGRSASSFRLHGCPAGGLVVGGEIDLTSSPTLDRMGVMVAFDVSQPVLDVSELRFVDAAGMRSIVQTLRTMGESHARVRLRGAGSTFMKMWDLLGCAGQIDAEFEPA